ncbi:hypothetical protein EVA_20436, partial [gut metagenome]
GLNALRHIDRKGVGSIVPVQGFLSYREKLTLLL